MKVYVSGGAKNGKSIYAQKLAKDMSKKTGKPLYYVATMICKDKEDEKRKERHIAERDGWGFITIEKPRAIADILSMEDVDRTGVFLIDAVTALLENEIFTPEYDIDKEAASRVVKDLYSFLEFSENVVLVSDYIYGDGDGYSKQTEDYREALAFVDKEVSKECDSVLEVVCGVPIEYK